MANTTGGKKKQCFYLNDHNKVLGDCTTVPRCCRRSPAALSRAIADHGLWISRRCAKSDVMCVDKALVVAQSVVFLRIRVRVKWLRVAGAGAGDLAEQSDARLASRLSAGPRHCNTTLTSLWLPPVPCCLFDYRRLELTYFSNFPSGAGPFQLHQSSYIMYLGYDYIHRLES